MQGICCVHRLLLSGILMSLLYTSAYSVSNTDEHLEKTLEMKQNFSTATETSQPSPIYINKPMKRFVGSIARQGALPSAYHGKRIESLDPTNRENELEAVKRFLGSIVRQGGLRNSRISSLPDIEPEQEVDHDEDSEFSKENPISTEKRHLASLAGNGDLRYYGSKGRRFLSSSPRLSEKRHVGSVARMGGIGPSALRMTGKRYLGSVVRGRDLPFRLKRSITDEFLSPDNEENIDVDSYPFNNDYLLTDDSEEDDLLMPMEKRHLASIARSGWLPYIRSQRKPSFNEKNVYRRNYRTSPSFSPRLTLLDWFRQEEERARDARLLAEQKKEQEAMENAEFQGKRTVASLARSGVLPSSYRPSRSARDTFFYDQNSPHASDAGVIRYHFSQPRGFVKSPHAFPSLFSSSWSRMKRSISSIARQGILRDSTLTNTESPCSSDSGENDVGCTSDNGISKRHIASLARTNQYPLVTGKRDSDSGENSFTPNYFDEEEFEENQFPYSEIGF